jgi:hypothetical protein
VGELSGHRRNKVFQVVTRVVQGFDEIFTGLECLFRFYPRLSNQLRSNKNAAPSAYSDL